MKQTTKQELKEILIMGLIISGVREYVVESIVFAVLIAVVLRLLWNWTMYRITYKIIQKYPEFLEDNVPRNSVEFGKQVSDAAMQDITIGHNDVEVTGIDEFEELEKRLRLSNKRIRSIQDEQRDDDILTDI